MTRKQLAQTILGLIDLTDLNEDCTAEDIEHLCARAKTPFGNTAAVCVWPSFVAQSKRELEGSGVKIATVVNFPFGGIDTQSVVTATEQAIDDGADEIDLVLPYNAFLLGDLENVNDMLSGVRDACTGTLKVILETGQLIEPETIRAASEIAIDQGADFIKTSTGKVDINATPDAARTMLEVIKERGGTVGFKPAGGLKTCEDARLYIDLARILCGDDYISSKTLRFGASGILNDVIAAIEGNDHINPPQEGY